MRIFLGTSSGLLHARSFVCVTSRTAQVQGQSARVTHVSAAMDLTEKERAERVRALKMELKAEKVALEALVEQKNALEAARRGEAMSLDKEILALRAMLTTVDYEPGLEANKRILEESEQEMRNRRRNLKRVERRRGKPLAPADMVAYIQLAEREQEARDAIEDAAEQAAKEEARRGDFVRVEEEVSSEEEVEEYDEEKAARCRRDDIAAVEFRNAQRRASSIRKVIAFDRETDEKEATARQRIAKRQEDILLAMKAVKESKRNPVPAYVRRPSSGGAEEKKHPKKSKRKTKKPRKEKDETEVFPDSVEAFFVQRDAQREALIYDSDQEDEIYVSPPAARRGRRL